MLREILVESSESTELLEAVVKELAADVVEEAAEEVSEEVLDEMAAEAVRLRALPPVHAAQIGLLRARYGTRSAPFLRMEAEDAAGERE